MGFLQILRAFPSPPEGFPRTLRVFLPDAYFRDDRRRLPVLYMQDGQNVFSHPESARAETWAANDILEGLIARGDVPPWIIVGIDHGLGRFEDYGPWPEARVGSKGRSDVYARFLIDHLKPFVDQTFRTRPEREWTAVAGSSLGGLVSLYLGFRYPQTYGRVGAFSPSVMWSEGRFFREWKHKGALRQRLYLDAGATELFEAGEVRMDYGTNVRRFAQHLRSLGYGEDELKVVLEPGGQHSEVDWRRRLPEALRWLLA